MRPLLYLLLLLKFGLLQWRNGPLEGLGWIAGLVVHYTTRVSGSNWANLPAERFDKLLGNVLTVLWWWVRSVWQILPWLPTRWNTTSKVWVSTSTQSEFSEPRYARMVVKCAKGCWNRDDGGEFVWYDGIVDLMCPPLPSSAGSNDCTWMVIMN